MPWTPAAARADAVPKSAADGLDRAAWSVLQVVGRAITRFLLDQASLQADQARSAQSR